MPISYVTTLPTPGDTEVQLLGKLLQTIGSFAQVGDTPTTLLARILTSFNASGAASSTYVAKAGDTMSGALTVNGLITGGTGGFQMNTLDSASLFAYNFTFQKRGTTGDATAAVGNASEIGNLIWQSWNGSAYVQNALVLAKTTQAQSPGNAGAEIQFRTCANGAASAGVAALISSNKNILVGNVNTIEPASLVGGIVFKDGTAATADPTTASAIWSVGGSLQYRTSGASEGSGQTNSLHNRAAQQYGVGTDYTLTNTLAQVNFGTTNATVTLPTAGTYLVEAQVSFITGTTAGDEYQAKLRNTTDSTDIGAVRKYTGPTAAALKQTIFLSEIVTVTASKAVQIFAQNATAARGSIEAVTTVMKYIRLS